MKPGASLAAIGVEILLVGVLLAGPAGAGAWTAAPAAAAADRCPRGSVATRIGGKRTCLAVGQRCKRRLDRQYHRYRFHCHSRRLTRVTVAENRWVTRVGAWATGFSSDVRDNLAFVPDWLAQRDRDSLAQLSEFARVLSGCRSQLIAFGPVTKRFRPAYTLFDQGCAHFAQAGDLYAQLVQQANPDLIARANTEIDAGLTSLGAGVTLLARLPR